MIKGLIVGRFMPPHKGHLALFKFARKRCDTLVVAVAFRKDDSMTDTIRLRWIKKLTYNDKGIIIRKIKTNIKHSQRSSKKLSKLWTALLQKKFGKIDRIFSSEKYGGYVAKYLGAEHISFDPKRKNFPVSGTKIRNNPQKYWFYISKVVRPYFENNWNKNP